MNKYHAIKTWSNLCSRMFDSRHEARRGEELKMLEMAGEISELEYQMPFILSIKPRIRVTVDFKYEDKGKIIYEDAKGVLTRDSRTKYAWLKEKHKVEVILS